jgi:acetate kinase
VTASDRVLCLNAGSSSLKFALWDHSGGEERCLLQGAVEQVGAPEGLLWLKGPGALEQQGRFVDHEAAFSAAWAAIEERSPHRPAAVGHRLVHGGPELFDPCWVDDRSLSILEAAIPFAPLHLPVEIAGIRAVAKLAPSLPQAVCFDTAFHRELPLVARRFALPKALAQSGIRRYGFHGLSCEYIVGHLGAALGSRAVIAHLGSGASLTAVHDGRSIDTTMGFSPTGGIPMGTRSGDLDPGLLLYLLGKYGDAKALERMVNHESGLLGISGLSADVRTLLAHRTEPDAALAIDLFCYGARKAVGGLAAALRGLDTLVFTGGIGEHAAQVRKSICIGLSHLGITLDEVANDGPVGSTVISQPHGSCRVWVVPTNEARMVARHVRSLLAQRQTPS